ncbi:MAG: RimK family alpha-L-glutamate ligase [Desulfobacterales bacterium]
MVIALESRIRECKNVITLGVKPNFSDYSSEEVELIQKAPKIYYPTGFYADLFDAAGKNIFPSYHTYKFSQDKIKQTAVFNILNIPHPRTRVFYGKRQKQKIGEYFQYPFVAKIARGSAMGRGVFLIKNLQDLDTYLSLEGPAYVQEYLPINRDMRMVVIGKRVVHAYWRKASDGEFRSNVAAGAEISFEKIPEDALKLALYTASACGWDDVGIDICCCNGKYYVLEGNMKYGKEGFRRAGIDYLKLMETLIENGEI